MYTHSIFFIIGRIIEILFDFEEHVCSLALSQCMSAGAQGRKAPDWRKLSRSCHVENYSRSGSVAREHT